MFRRMTTAAAAVLAAGLFVTACGGGTGPAMNAGPSAVPPPSPPAGGATSGNAILRVRCEAAGGHSKISLDGNNLAAGAYRASVRSGGNTATSDVRATVGDEVEFDFDSSPNDIRAGAIAIPPAFIQGGRVEAALSTAGGQVIASSGASCS